MRRTSAAPGTETTGTDGMSFHVLGIIGAYRMGRAVETRELCPRPVTKAAPEAAPRPAEGYIRNGVYHVADTAASRRA
ncbi:MAG: hypothetical protein M5U27_10230 [Gaiella sp.]|nr:hypothetical protein [Gaiella sp.]